MLSHARRAGMVWWWVWGCLTRLIRLVSVRCGGGLFKPLSTPVVVVGCGVYSPSPLPVVW